jgi:hypothetical protein
MKEAVNISETSENIYQTTWLWTNPQHVLRLQRTPKMPELKIDAHCEMMQYKSWPFKAQW